MDINTSEKDIREFINDHYKKYHEIEGRVYDPQNIAFEYVIVSNATSKPHLIPLIMTSGYQRIDYYVSSIAANRNFSNKFGIIFGKSDDIRFLLYENNRAGSTTIDMNYMEFIFKVKNATRLDRYGKETYKIIGLDLFDCESDNRPNGDVMPAYRYEKMILKYWGIDVDTLKSLPDSDERSGLPYEIRTTWRKFKELYKDTFGEEIGSRFEIITSSGVEKI